LRESSSRHTSKAETTSHLGVQSAEMQVERSMTLIAEWKKMALKGGMESEILL
jgi:hypothetical protein